MPRAPGSPFRRLRRVEGAQERPPIGGRHLVLARKPVRQKDADFNMSQIVTKLRRVAGRPAIVGEMIKDWAWKMSPACPPAVGPTWPVSDAERAGVRLIWPEAYRWPTVKIWFANLRQGLGRLVPVEDGPVPQPETGPIVVRFVVGGEAHDVGIDASDYLDYINDECLARVCCYFKMQYRRGGYGDERIRPGGYANSMTSFYRYLGRLRRMKDAMPPLHDVYGRFGLAFAGEVRKRAVALLREQSLFSFTGSAQVIRYRRYLEEISRARVCIDLPSNSDVCFRLMDYLGIGACIVGPPHRVEMHVPMVDREQIVHCAPDLSDLVSLCREYVEDDEARSRVTRQARSYFDRYLHRDQLAGYYLRTTLDVISGRAGRGAGDAMTTGPSPLACG